MWTSGVTYGSPLFAAAQNGHAGVVELLVGAKADVDVAWLSDQSTAVEGHLEAALLLLTAGARLEVRDLYGQSPLVSAGQHGHADVAEALLAAKANACQVGNLGWSALHFAIIGTQDVETVRVLLRCSASHRLAQLKSKKAGTYNNFKIPKGCSALKCA